jgi:predicted CXXCH cytochrome family protein
MSKRGMIFWVVGVMALLCGCDPVTRHEIISTIFDGVPSMPPAEQYCKDYHLRALSEEAESEKQKQMAKEKGQASVHPPFAEKHCDNCHDKNTDSGFVVPAKDLCNVCHPDFIKGAYSHGPAAVGACTMCHVPHNSQYQSLLKKPKGEICDSCHQEKRLAHGLHNMVKLKKMVCTDCHNPHGGNSRFFLE